jgi:hypothetical protein
MNVRGNWDSRVLILLIFLLAAITTTLYASLVLPPYNKAKPPSILLPMAYEKAIAAHGSLTNQYHCISANVTTTFSPDGDGILVFTQQTPVHG